MTAQKAAAYKVRALDDTLPVVRYKKSDRDAVCALLRAASSRAASDRLICQWDWKYDANPFNRDAEPYILLLKDGAQTIAMLGALPVRVVIAGLERWVAQTGDWVVHPDYRGRGLSRRLLSHCLADIPLRFAWANALSHEAAHSPTARSVPLAPLVHPLDVRRIVHRLTGNRWLSRWSGAVVERVRSLTRTPHRQPTLPGVSVAQATTFGPSSDVLWQHTCADYPVMVVRDQRYLNWRFVERPDARYTVLVAARGSELVGYLVLRVAEQVGMRWGYLVDFLVQHKSAALLALLIDVGIEHLRQQEVAAISCRVTMSPYRETIRSRGFYPFRWGPQAYFYMRVELADPALQAFRDERQWFVTMGDGDLEMSF